MLNKITSKEHQHHRMLTVMMISALLSYTYMTSGFGSSEALILGEKVQCMSNICVYICMICQEKEEKENHKRILGSWSIMEYQKQQ